MNMINKGIYHLIIWWCNIAIKACGWLTRRIAKPSGEPTLEFIHDEHTAERLRDYHELIMHEMSPHVHLQLNPDDTVLQIGIEQWDNHHLSFDQLADKGVESLKANQDESIKQANEILRNHK